MVKTVANMSVNENIYSNNIDMSNNGNMNRDLLSCMTKEQLINMILGKPTVSVSQTGSVSQTASTKVGPVVKTVSAKAGPVFRSLQAIITRRTSG